MREITDDKLKKYFKVTGKAIKKVKMGPSEGSPLHNIALDFMDMAYRYYKDAKYFYKKGDCVTAFAALNYAHGWLDAGARIGLFDVHDSKLFTVDEKSNDSS